MSARASKTQNGDLIVTGDLTVLGGINSATTSKTQKTAESSTVETVKLSGDMATVQEELADISSDNVLSPSDKIITKGEWTNIQAEEPYVLTQAASRGFGIGDTAYDNYTDAYDDLDDYITPLLADMDSSSVIDGDEFRAYFSAYYESRQALFSAEDQVGDIQSDATTTGGDPVFKFSLLNGEITVKKNDGTEIFKFDPTAQSLTVRGTIYADAGQFAGELNGAYGRLGSINTSIKYGTTKTFPVGTTQNEVYDWWVANIDTTPEGSMWPILGTYGSTLLYAGAIDTSVSTLYIYRDGTDLAFVNGSSTGIGSALTFTKIYYPAISHGHLSPSKPDLFNLGFLSTPWKYVISKYSILRDTTNNKRVDLYVDDTYNALLWIGYGSQWCRIGQYDATALILHSSGSQIRFGYKMSSKWSATYDGTSKTLIEGYSTNELIVNSSPVAIARGDSATEKEIFDTLSPVIPVGQYRKISGAVYASSNLYIFSHAYRYSSTQIRLFYIRGDGSQSYIAIVKDSSDTHNISISV